MIWNSRCSKWYGIGPWPGWRSGKGAPYSMSAAARVVASGLKWAPPWAVPVNLLVLPAALRSVTSLAGLRKPWSRLAAVTGDLRVETMFAGAVYVASGALARRD